MVTVRNFAAFAAVLALSGITASAQSVISAKSGLIAGVEGKVILDGQEVEPSETHHPQMKEGSILKTEEGRVEVLLPPGYMLRMGENGTLKLLTDRLIDTRVDLQAGSAILEVDQASSDYHVTIALKDGVVTVAKAGVYRFDSDPARIKVFEGQATVQIAEQSVVVPKGKMLALTGTSAAVEKFDPEQTDELDNWSKRRASEMAVANVSGGQYNGANSPKGNTGGSWTYNPYFGLYTYIPNYGRYCIQYYDVCYYSPYAAYQTFVAPPVRPSGGYNPGSNAGYSPMSGTSSSSATSVASAPSMSTSVAAPAAASSSAASASSSAGHGSAAGGGHGK